MHINHFIIMNISRITLPILLCCSILSATSCNGEQKEANSASATIDTTNISTNNDSIVTKIDTMQTTIDSTKNSPIDTITKVQPEEKAITASEYDQKFKEMGFVDVQTLDPTIQVDLKYSSTDNFMGINMYGDLHKAYLRPEIAKMVVNAQKHLKEVNPEYTLVIYDAARPLSAQRMMYNKVQGTPFTDYVAKPVNGGGYHNYGCAVDVTILHNGHPLDMGAGFDEFTDMSHINNEKSNLKKGKLSQEAYDNRQTLRNAMKKAGFDTYRFEWWHFQHYTKKYMRSHLKSIDF